MISTALLILGFGLVFCGIGLFLFGNGYQSEPGLEPLILCFWAGWALGVGFLQVWHLFFKVDLLPLGIVLVMAGWGWVRRRQALWAQVSAWNTGQYALSGLALIPALILANHVMFVPAHSDHFLYHLQSVKWIENYAIVPGLGNLQHRLAFNNANFLTAALLNAGWLAGRSYYISNTVLAYVLMLQCGLSFTRLLHSSQPLPKRHLYFTFMIPAVIWHISTTHLPGYSPDVPVFVLQVVLGGAFLHLVERGTERQSFLRLASFIALLAAAGIAVKLSFIVFGGLLLLTIPILWVKRFGFQPRATLSALTRPALLAAALILPWMLRGAIVSGYLFYPSTALPLPVAWKIPNYMAEPVAGVITTWARTASNQIRYTGNWAWFLNWLRFFPFEVKQGFAFSLLLFVLAGLGWLLWGRQARPDGAALTLLGISAVSILYWFALAPDYRFSGAVLWIFMVAVLLVGFSLLTARQVVRSPLMLAVSILLLTTLWLSPNKFSNNLSFRLLINPIPETQLALKAQGLETIQTRQTASGLTVYLPANSNGSCADMPLPCTQAADFTQKLRLFDPQNMQKGFYLDIPQMINQGDTP